MKKILTVVGTRPNFIKITQLANAFATYSDVFELKLLHTGQHFDKEMSEVFFEQLHIRQPDFYLGINNMSSKADLFAALIKGVSDTIAAYQPDLLIVIGDVNSTFAAAFAGYLAGIKIAHIESGLRSFDRAMPEEINRRLTDELCDILFVTEESGLINIGRENKSNKKVFFVGNTMIDTLVAFDDEIRKREILSKIGIEEDDYILMTMHRPSNVDNLKSLLNLINILAHFSANNKIIFPLHPRTKKHLEYHKLMLEIENMANVYSLPPAGYLDFQRLILSAKLILTDSGGIQEEATFRGVPCITIRENTERPITIKAGINSLSSTDIDDIQEQINHLTAIPKTQQFVPPLWDGKASWRIADALYSLYRDEYL